MKINGALPAGPGDPVGEHDVVTVDGRTVRPAAHTWILLHKPAGYVTSRAASERFPPVFDLLGDAAEALVAVGRLDVMSEGVLLLTTDGELAARLMHPRHEVTRGYAVQVTGTLDAAALASLRRGMTIDDAGPVKPLGARFTPDRAGGTLELDLAEGRNRVVRKLCAALGLKVRKLVRTSYGPIRLGTLASGRHRTLSAEEVTALYRAVDLDDPRTTHRAPRTGAA